MSKVIVVTSGKGGVGKTTSTASIGAALAQSGKRVCVVDFDVGLSNLDLVLGAERRVVYDFINVAQGDAKLTQALIRDKRVDTLHLLAASQTRDKDALTDEGVERVIGELRNSFDLVICDSPAGIERGALLAMRFADQAIVVANPEISSVRDSDRIIGLLDSKTWRAENGERMEKQLLLTRFDAGRSQSRRDAERRGRARHPLDPAARHHSRERGDPARLQSRRADHDRTARPSPAGRAYRDAARRLVGETVPVAIPAEKKPFSIACSAGGPHEPVQLFQGARRRARPRANGCRSCSPTSASRSARAIWSRSCATNCSRPSPAMSRSIPRRSRSRWTAPAPSRRWRSTSRSRATRSTRSPRAAPLRPRRRRRSG